jgi:hypothetical protein
VPPRLPARRKKGASQFGKHKPEEGDP